MNKYNNYRDNIKNLLIHPNTNFIMMGIMAVFICNISSPLEATITNANTNTHLSVIENKTHSPLIQNLERFNKVANFHLPQNIKANNISKHITTAQLEKKEYFLALASQAEGYRGNIYKDNEGWAIGNGWNLTKQSPEYNRALAEAVFSDQETIDTLTHMSAKSDKNVSIDQIKNVEISPQKALQVTYLIGEKIKSKYVIPGIAQVIQKNQKMEKEKAYKTAQKVFNGLDKHEQDTLIYHAYKCGGYSFLKFNNLITKIVDYSLKTKHVSKNSIIAEFDYSFKLNGKKVLDKQAQTVVGAMFLGPQHFTQVTDIKTVYFDAKFDTKNIKTAISNKEITNISKNIKKIRSTKTQIAAQKNMQKKS